MSSSKREKDILIFSSTRADYGILKGLISALETNENCSPSVLATGTHLEKKYGSTVDEIVSNHKCEIHRIAIPTKNTSPSDINSNMSAALMSFSNFLSSRKFDAVVILGDRYEALAFSIAAYNLHFPIVHLHGGELTEGALDDNYRHAISKFSYIHLCSSEEYLNRLLQLGEEPSRVFNIGSIGFQNAKTIPLLPKEKLEAALGCRFEKEIISVAFHPETNSNLTPKAQINLLLSSLESYADSHHIVFTSPNSDFGGDEIKQKIQAFIDRNKNSFYFSSLGSQRYFSLLKISRFLIGNSSSGVIEAPALNIHTINVGNRQRGRISSPSITHCPLELKSLKTSISEVHAMPQLKGSNSPLDGGDSIMKAERIILDMDFKNINAKKFHKIGKES